MSDSGFLRAQKYLVRDAQGNVYGPADNMMLRQWVLEGRIVAGMWIAPQETREWLEVTRHPAVADLLRTTEENAPVQEAQAPGSASPQPGQTLAPRPQSASQVQGLVHVSSTVAQVAYAAAPRHNVPGLLSFILSMVGMVSACGLCIPPLACVSVLLSLAAVVLGCIALWQMHVEPATYSGRGLAVAGTTVGGILILVYVLVMLAFAVAMIHSKP
jgi:hypothetical protein